MKKILLFVGMALYGVAMNAQLVTSRSELISYQPQEKKKPQTIWIVRAGLATNTFTGDFTKEMSSKIGYNMGIEFNRTIRDRGAYWGMDLLLGSRGYKYDYENSNYESTLSAHNIQWAPFTFGWKIDVADKFTVDPHIGIYFGMDYIANHDHEGYPPSGIGHNIDDLSGYSDFDMGFKLGIGFWYNKKYNIDFTYQRGVGYLSSIEDGDGDTSNFLIRLGYAF